MFGINETHIWTYRRPCVDVRDQNVLNLSKLYYLEISIDKVSNSNKREKIEAIRAHFSLRCKRIWKSAIKVTSYHELCFSLIANISTVHQSHFDTCQYMKKQQNHILKSVMNGLFLNNVTLYQSEFFPSSQKRKWSISFNNTPPLTKSQLEQYFIFCFSELKRQGAF